MKNQINKWKIHWASKVLFKELHKYLIKESKPKDDAILFIEAFLILNMNVDSQLNWDAANHLLAQIGKKQVDIQPETR